MGRPVFVSQIGRPKAGIGCGIAATMMLLNHHVQRGARPKYIELAKCLWTDVDPRVKGYTLATGYGAYLDDIVSFLKRQGIAHWFTCPRTSATPKTLQRMLTTLAVAPCILGMYRKGDGRWGPYGHWIVAYRYEGRREVIRYLDPQYRGSDTRHDSTLAVDDLRQCWDGSAVGIYKKYRRLPVSNLCSAA